MKKVLVGLSVVVVGVVALIIGNPFADEPEYIYDDAALRIAVEGTWTVHIASTPPRELSVTVTEAKDTATRHSSRRSFVRSAAACSHRTFVRSAEACMDISEMTLDVRVAGAPPTEGRLMVVGFTFDRGGDLHLALGDHEGITADVSPLGEASGARYYHGEQSAPVTMIRTSAR